VVWQASHRDTVTQEKKYRKLSPAVLNPLDIPRKTMKKN
jgi:hypothetical protein